MSPKSGHSRIYTRQWGPCLISPHFFYAWTLAVDNFFYFDPQKRSRITKLGEQTQHRVMQRFLPPFTSKQFEITCAKDKGVVFSNIGQAISGNTDHVCFFNYLPYICKPTNYCNPAALRLSIPQSGGGNVTTFRWDHRLQIQKKKSCLKKNLNAPRPSEHPPVRGKKCQNV